MAASPGDPGAVRHPRMLGDPASVIRALMDYHATATRVSTSLVSVTSQGRRRLTDGYGYGTLARIEEHEELIRRMRELDERDRLLLMLWYAQGWPVTDIAKRLGISRVHCYRLRNRAIQALIGQVPDAQRSKPSTPRLARPIALPSRGSVAE